MHPTLAYQLAQERIADLHRHARSETPTLAPTEAEMTGPVSARRLLGVFAHPDDEVFCAAGTMARAAERRRGFDRLGHPGRAGSDPGSCARHSANARAGAGKRTPRGCR